MDQLVADYGTTADDAWVDGTSGVDNIYGLDGEDTLVGREGNDQLYGGNGYDQANYFGSSTQFTFALNNDGTVTVTDTVSNEGVDILHDVEALYFDGDDTWMSVDQALGLSSLSPPEETEDALVSLHPGYLPEHFVAEREFSFA